MGKTTKSTCRQTGVVTLSLGVIRGIVLGVVDILTIFHMLCVWSIYSKNIHV